MRAAALWTALPLALLSACADTTKPGDGDDHDHNHGVITTVGLEFLPESGGTPLVFTWADPEGDGSPTIEPVALEAGVSYRLELSFWNELDDPATDLTHEVEHDAAVHQIFFTGDAVVGPAALDNTGAPLVHSYADQDENGLPIGLLNTIQAEEGTGTLTVTLRHMPPESGSAVKTAEAAGIVSAEGFGALGGDSDAQVDFPVTVD